MTKYDELNVIPIEEYFDEMEISQEEKDKRIAMAFLLLDSLGFIFDLLKDADSFNDNYLTSVIMDEFANDISSKFELNDADYIYLALLAGTIISQTRKNKDNKSILSENRKILIAENESNSICNRKQFEEEIASGKTFKTWNTIIDRKERPEHRYMDGKTIPINDYFVFKDCKMLYPHDYENGTDRQLANCRCWCTYK